MPRWTEQPSEEYFHSTPPEKSHAATARAFRAIATPVLVSGREGEAPAEPRFSIGLRLGGSPNRLALPFSEFETAAALILMAGNFHPECADVRALSHPHDHAVEGGLDAVGLELADEVLVGEPAV